MLETMTSAWTELAQSYMHQALMILGSFFSILGILLQNSKSDRFYPSLLLNISKFEILLDHRLKHHDGLLLHAGNRHFTFQSQLTICNLFNPKLA